MTQEDAIRVAIAEVARQRMSIHSGDAKVFFKQGHMSRGRDRSGWLVVFRLAVPEGFEPNHLRVEVYEPDGEVHIPIVL